MALAILILLIVLGTAAVFGRTADSRDTEYSLGQVLRTRRRG